MVYSEAIDDVFIATMASVETEERSPASIERACDVVKLIV